MEYNRITTMNQYGDILYTGKFKQRIYKNIGDYAENLTPKAIEQILIRLYLFEEMYENFIDSLYMIKDKDI